MKKIVISGPINSRSGYGNMCRFAFHALKNRKDTVDLYLLPTTWGGTGNLFENDEERKEIEQLVLKTHQLIESTKNQPGFDVAIQVTIPNEWKKLAPYNIGYTAGIETNFISPAWLQPSLAMDKIIVISEHAKSGFVDTVLVDANANAGRGVQYRVTTPVEVCHFPVRELEPADINLKFKHDFNFLAVCQWGPRKNLEQTIINFVEEFKYDEIGLILKINTTNDSLLDKEQTKTRLATLLAALPQDRTCSVNFIHGHMSDKEMVALYRHPQVKALISTTHGEGFGFPMFEATCAEKPVIATDWSGHLDFLTMKDEDGVEKKMFAKVDFELKPLAREHIWQGVLEEGTSWAYPIPSSFKSRMREVFKDYDRFKSWSKKLNKWVKEEFKEQKVKDKFYNLVTGQFNVEDWLNQMNVEENVFEHD